MLSALGIMFASGAMHQAQVGKAASFVQVLSNAENIALQDTAPVNNAGLPWTPAALNAVLGTGGNAATAALGSYIEINNVSGFTVESDMLIAEGLQGAAITSYGTVADGTVSGTIPVVTVP